MSVHTIQGVNVFQTSLVVAPTLNANCTLGDSREHLRPIQHGRRAILHLHAFQPSDGQQGGIDDAIVELAQAGLNVAPKVDAFERGVLAEELGLPTEGGGPDDRPVGQVGDRLDLAVRGDEGIVGVLTREVAGEDGAIGEPRGHVLHRVDADVHLIAQEGSVEFFREQSLPAQFHEGLIEDHVALCFHDADFDGTVLFEFGKLFNETTAGFVSLSKGKGGPTSSNSEGGNFSIFCHEKSRARCSGMRNGRRSKCRGSACNHERKSRRELHLVLFIVNILVNGKRCRCCP
mmetsp:Transcript_20505/g.43995  ORF Transcript_20505/g.43995 Transcript_20505/m.43995 type:complete len:289 (-) Transcript_20505:108-974(-)